MELTAAQVWSRILERARLVIPEQAFLSWLDGTEPETLTHERLEVRTSNGFAAEWIDDKYSDLLQDIGERLFGRRLTLVFTARPEPRPSAVAPLAAEPEASAGRRPQRPAAPAARGQLVGSPLNDRYSFERFVVGESNQFAAAACRAVAEAPGRVYNPLFVYGGVGLGKTHLMHCIGHACLAQQGRRIAYVSCERFMNELIAAIKEGRPNEFRRRYREIDVLLLDDVHFLGDKERTQEEFFHTFNALYEAQRQIVVTSDRLPKEIPGLEKRLTSRFDWGLVADIRPPDLETRIAILRKKAEDDRIALGDEVLEFIARHCRSNVRELEGAIIKLLAYASLNRRDITPALAREVMAGSFAAGQDETLTPNRIRSHVAARENVTVEGLVSKKRTKDLTVPRQIAMYLIREMLHLPLTEIGRLFGGRDHTTVIHSVEKVEQQMTGDEVFRERVLALRRELEA
jgi:chromosomal replication initiator protein